MPIGGAVADYGKTHEISMLLLETMERKQISRAYGMLGCALSLGRLSSDHELDDEEEVRFIEDIMHYIGAYWPEGGES